MKNLPPKTSRVGEPNNPWRTLAAATNPTNHIARSGTAEQRTSLLRPAQPNYNSTQASGWMFSAKRRSFIVFTSSSPIASHPLIKATTQQNKCLPWQSVSTRLLVRRLNQVGYIYSYLNTTNFFQDSTMLQVCENSYDFILLTIDNANLYSFRYTRMVHLTAVGSSYSLALLCQHSTNWPIQRQKGVKLVTQRHG